MPEYVTKIRTIDGDKQIDYNALANLPEQKYTTAEQTKLASIDEGATKTVIIDSLESTSTIDALSANQGKILDEKIVAAINNLGDIASKDVIALEDLSESVQASLALADSAIQNTPEFNPGDIGAAEEVHTHDASDIVSGNIAIERLSVITPAAIGAASLSDGKVKADQASSGIKIVDDAAYTLIAEDAGKFIRFNSELTAVTLTIPDDTSNSMFPIGTEIEICLPNKDGVITLATATTTTQMFTAGGPSYSVNTYGCYPLLAIKKIYYHKWIVKGDLE